MEKYFYFRDATNEDADLTAAVSATIPVKNITGIGPHNSNATLNIWFKNLKNEAVNDYVTLTVNRGRLKEVTHSLVSAMNGGPHSDGFVVVADLVTTTDGATSIQGDDITVSSQFLTPHITSAALVTS
jgi:hypothetical protein